MSNRAKLAIHVLINPIHQLYSIDGYRRHFMDVAYWTPYVRWVCEREGGPAADSIRIGLPGTYPTFIVDDRWVVKFFGTLFEGGAAFEAEYELNQLLGADPTIQVPRLIASDNLFEGTSDWRWPYLVFEFIPGISIGEVYDEITDEDRIGLARELARITQKLHTLPIRNGRCFQPTWQGYRDLLSAQRRQCANNHRRWQSLPEHLVEQLDSFLPPVDELIDPSLPPHLIHADLTGDHVLGQMTGSGWCTLAIIDFGDAMVGDLLYELVALHMDLFRLDKRLLAAYLDAYGVSNAFRETLATRAMAVALLHRFNVFEGIPARYPELTGVPSLEEFAQILWDVETAGVVSLCTCRDAKQVREPQDRN